jgi:hypothetical protein
MTIFNVSFREVNSFAALAEAATAQRGHHSFFDSRFM